MWQIHLLRSPWRSCTVAGKWCVIIERRNISRKRSTLSCGVPQLCSFTYSVQKTRRDHPGSTKAHLWIPHLLLRVKCHGSVVLVTTVSTSKLRYILLKHYQYRHEKEYLSLACFSHVSFPFLRSQNLVPTSGTGIQVSCATPHPWLRRTKPLPWPSQWTFCLETLKLWLHFEPEGASSGLCQPGCPGTQRLEETWWIGKKKKKRNKTPFLFHFPKASLTPFHFETKMCESCVLEGEDGLNSQVWG